MKRRPLPYRRKSPRDDMEAKRKALAALERADAARRTHAASLVTRREERAP